MTGVWGYDGLVEQLKATAAALRRPFSSQSPLLVADSLHSSSPSSSTPLLAAEGESLVNMAGTKTGNLRAYWLAAVVCIGGFLFGYDSGVMGGIIGFKSFMSDFGYSKSDSTTTSSYAISLQSLGAFVGCFSIFPITHRYGRKYPICLCMVVFIIGLIICIINSHSLPAFYVGRVISGLGLGAATVIVPMYNGEMAPKEIRGQVGCFFQLFYTLGIFTSYWIDYGVSKHISSTSTSQWQIPYAMQFIFASFLGLGVLTLEESVRWHMANGDHAKAWKSLVWVRGGENDEVRAEFEEIKAGIELELREKSGFKITELLEPKNAKRCFTGFCIFLGQQSTGATAFAYYAPSYFKKLVGGSGTQNLLITGIFGAVKVAACGSFVFLLAARVPRRPTLVIGAIGMAICFYVVTGIVDADPPPAKPPTDGNTQVSSSGIATVAFIYLFVMIYNASWGALPWAYIGEIFPVRIREIGIGIGAATQWLFNFVYTYSTPYMINNMGSWGVFLFWGVTNTIIAVCTFFFLRETNHLSLEVINARYEGNEDALANKVVTTGEDDLSEGAAAEHVDAPAKTGNVHIETA